MNGYSIYNVLIVDRQRVTMRRPPRTVIISRRSHLRQTIGLNEVGGLYKQNSEEISELTIYSIYTFGGRFTAVIQYDTLSYTKQTPLFRRYSY